VEKSWKDVPGGKRRSRKGKICRIVDRNRTYRSTGHRKRSRGRIGAGRALKSRRSSCAARDAFGLGAQDRGHAKAGLLAAYYAAFAATGKIHRRPVYIAPDGQAISHYVTVRPWISARFFVKQPAADRGLRADHELQTASASSCHCEPISARPSSRCHRIAVARPPAASRHLARPGKGSAVLSAMYCRGRVGRSGVKQQPSSQGRGVEAQNCLP